MESGNEDDDPVATEITDPRVRELADRLSKLQTECRVLLEIPPKLEKMWVEHIYRSEEFQRLSEEQQACVNVEEYTKAAEYDAQISALELEQHRVEITRAIEALAEHDTLLRQAQELYNEIQAEKNIRVQMKDWMAAEQLKTCTADLSAIAQELAKINNADEVLQSAQHISAQEKEDRLTAEYKGQLQKEQEAARKRTAKELEQMEVEAETRRDADVERKVRLYHSIFQYAQKLPKLPKKLSDLVMELEPIKAKVETLKKQQIKAAQMMDFVNAQKLTDQLKSIDVTEKEAAIRKVAAEIDKAPDVYSMADELVQEYMDTLERTAEAENYALCASLKETIAEITKCRDVLDAVPRSQVVMSAAEQRAWKLAKQKLDQRHFTEREREHIEAAKLRGEREGMLHEDKESFAVRRRVLLDTKLESLQAEAVALVLLPEQLEELVMQTYPLTKRLMELQTKKLEAVQREQFEQAQEIRLEMEALGVSEAKAKMEQIDRRDELWASATELFQAYKREVRGFVAMEDFASADVMQQKAVVSEELVVELREGATAEEVIERAQKRLSQQEKEDQEAEKRERELLKEKALLKEKEFAQTQISEFPNLARRIESLEQLPQELQDAWVQLIPKEADVQRLEVEIKAAVKAEDFEEAFNLELELKALDTDSDRKAIEDAMKRFEDAPKLHHEVREMEKFLIAEKSEATKAREFDRAAECKEKLEDVKRYLGVFERRLPKELSRISQEIAEASADVPKFKQKLMLARVLDQELALESKEEKKRLSNLQNKIMQMNRTRSWPKKDTYTGATKDSVDWAKGGVPEGDGSMVYANFPFTGDAFTGQFEKGRPHGVGTYVFANQDMYKGTWKQGKRHGQGIHTFSSGKQEVRTYRNGVRLSDEEVERERQARRNNGVLPDSAMTGASIALASDLEDVVVLKKKRPKSLAPKSAPAE